MGENLPPHVRDLSQGRRAWRDGFEVGFLAGSLYVGLVGDGLSRETARELAVLRSVADLEQRRAGSEVEGVWPARALRLTAGALATGAGTS